MPHRSFLSTSYHYLDSASSPSSPNLTHKPASTSFSSRPCAGKLTVTWSGAECMWTEPNEKEESNVQTGRAVSEGLVVAATRLEEMHGHPTSSETVNRCCSLCCKLAC
jgi:hypothetical protein